MLLMMYGWKRSIGEKLKVTSLFIYLFFHFLYLYLYPRLSGPLGSGMVLLLLVLVVGVVGGGRVPGGVGLRISMVLGLAAPNQDGSYSSPLKNRGLEVIMWSPLCPPHTQPLTDTALSVYIYIYIYRYLCVFESSDHNSTEEARLI